MMKTGLPKTKIFLTFIFFLHENSFPIFFKRIRILYQREWRLISLDITDNDYYGCILSRDESKQSGAELVSVSIETIEEAGQWIHEKMSNNFIVFHDNEHEYFDVFKNLNINNIHITNY